MSQKEGARNPARRRPDRRTVPVRPDSGLQELRPPLPPGGLQRLFAYAWGESYSTADLGDDQNTMLKRLRGEEETGKEGKLARVPEGLIPDSATSFPALLTNTQTVNAITSLFSSGQRLQNTKLGFVDIALIAAAMFPSEGYAGGNIPKLKEETPEHKLFRLAMGSLKGQDTQPQRTIDDLQEMYQDTFKPEVIERYGIDKEELKRGRESLIDILFVKKFYKGLSEGYIDQDSVKQDLEDAARSFERRKIVDVDMYEIFRRGESDTTRIVTERRQTAAPRELLALKDNPRVQELMRRVTEWEPDNTDPDLEPRVLALRFKEGTTVASGTGKVRYSDPYFVAVLPKRFPDGRVAEYAVLDSAKDNNAAFVYHAGYELRHNLNWIEVFDKARKSEVKLFGAKWVKHTGDWTGRIDRHLKLSVDELPSIEI